MQNETAAYAGSCPVFNKKKQISIIALSLFTYLVVTTLLQFISSIILNTFFPDIAAKSYTAVFVALLPQYLVGFPLLFLIIRRAPRTDVKKLIADCGMAPISKINVAKAFLISYSGMYLTNFATVMIIIVLALIFGFNYSNPLTEVLPMENIIVNGIMAGVIGPIFEELIFRKLIIDRTIIFGSKTAIIFSAVTFGLFHGNFMQCFYAAVIGLVCAYVYTRSGNIVYPILLHMGINLCSSVIIPLFMLFGGMWGMLTVSLIILAMVISGGVIFMLNRKKLLFINSSYAVEKGRRFGTFILNAGMILFIVIIAALFVYTTLTLFTAV